MDDIIEIQKLKTKLDKISKSIQTCNSEREYKKILKKLEIIKAKINLLDSKLLLKYYDDDIKLLNNRHKWLQKKEELRKIITNTYAAINYIKNHPSKNKENTDHIICEIENSMTIIMDDAEKDGYKAEALLCKSIINNLVDLKVGE